MTEQDAWTALAGVVDPELGLDIVELGLVYGVYLSGDDVHVTMTLTTPGCPLHDVIADGAERALRAAGARTADIEVVWDPPWDPSRIGQGGLKELGAPGAR